MTQIEAMCERRRMMTPMSDRSCTYKYMNNTLEQYSSLFSSLDVILGYLQIINPNVKELTFTADVIRITKAIQNEMGFSIIPKVHTLFSHVSAQQQLYGGLTDTCEDWIEQSHQTGMRL